MQKKKVKVLGTETLSGGKATLTLKANAVLKKAITSSIAAMRDSLTSTVRLPRYRRIRSRAWRGR